jgi:hypothetical protein
MDAPHDGQESSDVETIWPHHWQGTVAEGGSGDVDMGFADQAVL